MYKPQKGKVVIRDRRDIHRLMEKIAYHLLFNRHNLISGFYMDSLYGRKCILGEVFDCSLLLPHNGSSIISIFLKVVDYRMRDYAAHFRVMLQEIQTYNDSTLKYNRPTDEQILAFLEGLMTSYPMFFDKKQLRIVQSVKIVNK